MANESNLGRRDFLKVAGVAAAAVVAGDIGRSAADAGVPGAAKILVERTFDKLSSGKWAVRTDELRDLSKEEFDGRLATLKFNLSHAVPDDVVPKIEPVKVEVYNALSDSTNQVVAFTSGDQQYSAQLRPYSFTTVNGEKREGVFPEFVDSNNRRLETLDRSTGFEKQLWTAIQQIFRLTKQETFSVYLGVAINDVGGKRFFASPVTEGVERESTDYPAVDIGEKLVERELNHTYYSAVDTEKGPRYFVSTETRTGLSHFVGNLSADAVNRVP